MLSKSYLRYVSDSSFGLIASPECNTVFLSDVLCATGSLDAVCVWNLRQGRCIATFNLKNLTSVASTTSENVISVTNLAVPRRTRGGKANQLLGAGYSDGSVRIWNVDTKQLVSTFNGHRSAVSALAFSESTGAKSSAFYLASGGRDTDVIIWDLVAEVGVCRLRSHKDMVTELKFISKNSRLISSSKDGLLKVWDLSQQACVQTLVGHQGEVWSFDVNPNEDRIVSGGVEDEVRVWKLKGDESADFEVAGTAPLSEKTKFGKKIRVGMIRYSEDGSVIYVSSTEKFIERLKVRTVEEIKKKKTRKLKRMKQKSEASDKEASDIAQDQEEFLEIEDKIPPVRIDSKIKFFDIIGLSERQRNADRLVIVEQDNALTSLNVLRESGKWEYEEFCKVDIPGHRAGIRGVSWSSDDSQLLSCANGSVKLWNMFSYNLLRTFETGQAMCVSFLPGNQYFIVGTKLGFLELFHIPSGEVVEKIPAHSGGPVWSIDLDPAGNGLVSAGADHEVKFWEFEMITCSEENSTEPKLSLTHTKTLKIQDEVLAVRWSKDGKYIATASIDCQVRIFFTDTLKLHLVLYGHKLPVLSIDISDDARLLVTGSADKTIKVWGLDFGDCHKSFPVAHEDAVMCVRFVPRTHYFFSCGKDKRIRHWDADKFVRIQTVSPADMSEIWTFAVNHAGTALASGGNSKAVRVFKESTEPVFVEEENEKELERVFEQEAVKDADALLNEENQPGAIEGAGLAGPGETGAAGKSTLDNLKASERLMEYLDIAEKEIERLREAEGKVLSANPLMMGKSVEEIVLYALSTVPTSDLQVTLIMLPLEYALRLLKHLNDLVEKKKNVELCVRCQLYILQTHHQQLTAGDKYIDLLKDIGKNSKKRLREFRDQIGFNLAALKFASNQCREASQSSFGEPRQVTKKIKLAPA